MSIIQRFFKVLFSVTRNNFLQIESVNVFGAILLL